MIFPLTGAIIATKVAQQISCVLILIPFLLKVNYGFNN